MYHKVTIVGNVGRDPEMRYTADGTPVTSFSVATSDKRKDRDTGERHDRTIWWRVSAWRKLAETCNEYLTKGRLVLIEGTMAFDEQTGGPRMWTDKEGKQRASYEINATEVRFLGGQQSDGAGGSAGRAPGGGEHASSEDDLPFVSRLALNLYYAASPVGLAAFELPDVTEA